MTLVSATTRPDVLLKRDSIVVGLDRVYTFENLPQFDARQMQ